MNLTIIGFDEQKELILEDTFVLQGSRLLMVQKSPSQPPDMVLKPWINDGIFTIAGDRRIFSINRISKSVGLCVFKTSPAMGNCNGGLWHCCTEGELEPWRGSGGKVRCSER